MFGSEVNCEGVVGVGVRFDGGGDWIGLGVVSGVLIMLGFVGVLGGGSGGVGVGGNVVVVLMLMGMLSWLVGMVGGLG